MISFPNAKINLGLNIVSKRPDGYHNIESCFYPIPLHDVLEIIPSDTLHLSSSGLDIPGTTESNLCIKAFNLLRERYDIPPVKIHLHKVIPMGAGMGGGSADGAFTLKMLNSLFNLDLKTEQLEDLASILGSDCPFFIQNTSAFATGRGTDLESISVNLQGYYLALKNPGIHIGTKEAYSKIAPTAPAVSIREIVTQPITNWRSQLHNDFERSVFPLHPYIEEVKNNMYFSGALYASMTGSGSTVYGIFDEKPNMSDSRILLIQ